AGRDDPAGAHKSRTGAAEAVCPDTSGALTDENELCGQRSGRLREKPRSAGARLDRDCVDGPAAHQVRAGSAASDIDEIVREQPACGLDEGPAAGTADLQVAAVEHQTSAAGERAGAAATGSHTKDHLSDAIVHAATEAEVAGADVAKDFGVGAAGERVAG